MIWYGFQTQRFKGFAAVGSLTVRIPVGRGSAPQGQSAISKFESSRPSQAVRAFDHGPQLADKGPRLAGFRVFGKVSRQRNRPWAPPNSRKSLADCFKIPVLALLRLESRFDRHCGRAAALSLGQVSHLIRPGSGAFRKGLLYDLGNWLRPILACLHYLSACRTIAA